MQDIYVRFQLNLQMRYPLNLFLEYWNISGSTELFGL